MDFEKIIKFIKVRGGYPNPKMDFYLQMFDVTQNEFLYSMFQTLGDEGTKKFLEKSLKKMSKESIFRVKVESLEEGSYLDINFKNVSVLLSDMDDLRYNTTIIDNWQITSSEIIYNHIDENGEGEIKHFDIDSLMDFIFDEDPYQYSEAVDEWTSFISNSISKYLGVPVALGERKLK